MLHGLHNQVNLLLVAKESVNRNEAWVTKVCPDLDLVNESFDQVCVSELLLLDYFECHYKLASPFNSQHYFPKASLLKFFNYQKVINADITHKGWHAYFEGAVHCVLFIPRLVLTHMLTTQLIRNMIEV